MFRFSEAITVFPVELVTLRVKKFCKPTSNVTGSLGDIYDNGSGANNKILLNIKLGSRLTDSKTSILDLQNFYNLIIMPIMVSVL